MSCLEENSKMIKIILSGSLSFGAGVLASLLISATISEYGPVVFFYIRSNLGEMPAILVPFICMLLGLIAYTIRSFSRFIYGAMEIFFGVISSSLSVVQFSQSKSVDISLFPLIIGFLSGLYVIVRGLDNLVTGMKNGSTA